MILYIYIYNIYYNILKLSGKLICFFFLDGNRRPAPSYKPSLPSLDSSFHRDKNLSTTENSQYDLKPESETPQQSSTIKKDASHQETLIEYDDTKNHTSNSSVGKDRVESTAIDDSAIQNATKKHESEESTKKHIIIHKYHTPSKENKINSEETLILGLATDITPTHTTRHPQSSIATSSNHVKVTKSSKSEEKMSATSKAETPIEKTTTLKTFSTSTLNIETSSSVQVIESMSTKVVLRPTATTAVKSSVDTKFDVNLEPSSASDIEYAEPTSSISTPTDGLPTTYSKNSATTEKNVHATTSTIFTKNTGT